VVLHVGRHALLSFAHLQPQHGSADRKDVEMDRALLGILEGIRKEVNEYEEKPFAVREDACCDVGGDVPRARDRLAACRQKLSEALHAVDELAHSAARTLRLQRLAALKFVEVDGLVPDCGQQLERCTPGVKSSSTKVLAKARAKLGVLLELVE
jgi:hypothetical protein